MVSPKQVFRFIQGRGGLVLLILASLGILVLALVPSNHTPVTGFSDKFNHVLAFTTLTLLLGFQRHFLKTWQIILVLLGYGVLIEVLQSFTGYRSAEWADVLADFIGILIGLTLLFALKFVRDRRKSL